MPVECNSIHTGYSSVVGFQCDGYHHEQMDLPGWGLDMLRFYTCVMFLMNWFI